MFCQLKYVYCSKSVLSLCIYYDMTYVVILTDVNSKHKGKIELLYYQQITYYQQTLARFVYIYTYTALH